jgi:hypothetical protein
LPSATKFTAIPLVFALGSLTLLLKGIFLLRKSPEGLGLSEQELAGLSGLTNRKRLPSIATQAAQIVQDFGTGAFLPWPLLGVGKDIDNSWNNPRRFLVFLTGAVLFLLRGSYATSLRLRPRKLGFWPSAHNCYATNLEGVGRTPD